ncbi:protein-(glutamine-N5) methyltransferase, release factor-specific [Thermaerobacter marianensis DSM 12885]|uniref:Release factor glutamine methyltransferase n=1 Tax=Thermaerobacter marianensis (strain ATCC 700841 / DSM 12885 / JCM 10246 / 7p75a) TaxID=644966 RepID=E6SLL4_THEM7|nr:peptide chain release factor N(5)-glutamine methyltransferase [Thermaerobacter marianensis]ADU50281.1 protein-(glutamine-N5) methyltransferase, release factor-specific [Thermaerobacter marianensis DSM 12885]
MTLPTQRPQSAGAALAWARTFLEGAGLDPDEARASARVLLGAALDLPGARVVAEPDLPLPPAAWARFVQWILRRARREPVAYILQQAEFYGRPFRVTPATLIPRPETEVLVEVVLRTVPAGPAVVADLGTGTGIVAVTLAAERPAWTVLASDCSAAALKVARENAARHGVDGRMRFYVGDWAEPLLAAGWAGKLAAVASNPPYVAAADLPRLQAEIHRYEPHLALTPGATGLEAYRRLIPGAVRLLAPGGWIFLEVGAGQAPAVQHLLGAVGCRCVSCWPDLAGIPRVVGGQWPA